MKNLYKGITRSITGLLVTAGLAGGLGCATEPPGGEDDPVSEADPAVVRSAGLTVITIYYAEPELLHIVGTCTSTTCPNLPRGTRCTGVTTPYSKTVQHPCVGGT